MLCGHTIRRAHYSGQRIVQDASIVGVHPSIACGRQCGHGVVQVSTHRRVNVADEWGRGGGDTNAATSEHAATQQQLTAVEWPGLSLGDTLSCGIASDDSRCRIRR